MSSSSGDEGERAVRTEPVNRESLKSVVMDIFNEFPAFKSFLGGGARKGSGGSTSKGKGKASDQAEEGSSSGRERSPARRGDPEKEPSSSGKLFLVVNAQLISTSKWHVHVGLRAE